MVIRGANYRSDSWTLRLFNLIAALKRCLADGSAITIGKECLRRCLEFVCLAVDMHKKTWYKRKTGKNKQTKKTTLKPSMQRFPAFESQLKSNFSNSSLPVQPVPINQWLRNDGTLYRSVHLSLRLPTGLCPEKFSDRWATVLLSRAFLRNKSSAFSVTHVGAERLVRKSQMSTAFKERRSQGPAPCWVTWIMHLRMKEAWKSNTYVSETTGSTHHPVTGLLFLTIPANVPVEKHLHFWDLPF